MDWTLRRHPRFAGVKGPVVACILDGVGIGAHDESDAVWLARTPNLDWLAASSLATRLRAHGRAVGMRTRRQPSTSPLPRVRRCR